MPPTPRDITQQWAELLVEELVRCGVDRVVMAPGSRSTPLVAACVRNPRMSAHLHVDERGAAFFALGIARATGRPAAWLTTSGTAAANGLPAAIEAAQDGVPLLLVTADRPPELRDTGANQTIRQPGLFASVVRWEIDLAVPDGAIDPAYVLTSVDQAVRRAMGPHPGPVHVNAMFRKPLEPSTSVGTPVAPSRWSGSDRPYTEVAPVSVEPDVAGLVSALAGARRPMIVAGRLSAGEAVAVRRLARATGWPVVADVLSGLPAGADGIVRRGHLLVDAQAGLPEPDAVIEVGRPGVSTRVRGYLDRVAPAVRAVVADGADRIDPGHGATHRLEGSASVLEQLATAGLRDTAGWGTAWIDADRHATRVLGGLLEDGTLSEPGVAWHLGRRVSPEHGLFLASSLPVRHMDAFAGPGVAPDAPAPVSANRGASGIDGTVSTAAGFAEGLGMPVTLLIGDLALLHDLNGLALLADRPVVTVVLNNDGGGIFSFLPIAEHEALFEPWFSAAHGRTFEAAARQFDLPYHAPGTMQAFAEAWTQATDSGRSALIEIRTDRAGTRSLVTRLVDEVHSAITVP